MGKEPQGIRKIATPKQTAGGGFAFEDEVVAYYLAWMLNGASPFVSISFPIDRIDCQVRADGWFLDDLLLTFTHNQEKCRYAFSIKSNIQFSPNSVAPEFLNDVWSLYLHNGSDVFNPDYDFLGLICIHQPNPPIEALRSLLRKARFQNPEQLSLRLEEERYASEEERILFRAFSCPKHIDKDYEADSEATANLLKRISVIELDFDRNESSDAATAKFLCQGLLSDAYSDRAEDLWNNLCKLAQKIRISGGGYTREGLLKELLSRFEFRDFLDYSKDWKYLRTWSESEIENIRERIGGEINIPRKEIFTNILNGISSSKFTALVGASGTGKTVLGKWIAGEYSNSNALWFDAGRLRTGYLESFESNHLLSHNIKDVFRHSRSANGLVVIDSGERLFAYDDFKEATNLFHLLGLDQPGCTWKVLLLCQAEAWERVQLEINRHFGQIISWNSVTLPPFQYEDLQPVWQKFPSIHMLALRPHLANFMLNPKVLDILAMALLSGQVLEDKAWVGEWDVIKWYWMSVVREGEKGTARSSLLQRVAEVEANSGKFELPEMELSTSEQELVPNLGGILRIKEDRAAIAFAHDLFADWARLYAILSHEETLMDYVKDKLTNPHWHKALRLYGLVVLEGDQTAKVWENKMKEFPEISNFLLEALIFAGNSNQLLSQALPILTSNDGKLLRDLLMRFLYVATIPNPRYMQIAKEIGARDTEARTWERLPLWIYWLGILKFLAEHVDDIVELARIEVGRVAYTWLRYAPLDWPGRENAATLALTVGQLTFQNRYYYHRSDKDKQIPYKALLEAFPDKPVEVQQLALKACARIIPDETDGDAFDAYQPPGTEFYSESKVYGGKRVVQEPWENGPLYRKDQIFTSVCLETDALRTIIERSPELACEIILALLIEVRPQLTEWEDNHWSAFHGRHVGIDSEVDISFFPRFYTRGPFLQFLNINPQYAIETITKLVDFSTDRWLINKYKENVDLVGFDLPIQEYKKFFIGDSNVYHWYHSIAGSTNSIPSMLMALEKWLYDCIDRGEDIAKWVTQIFEKSRSVAFIGMLSEVGRYAPELFTGILEPLLLTPETYYFEQLYSIQGGHNFGTPFSFQEGEWFFNLAKEWDAMEHRRRKIINIASHFFHNHAKIRENLIKASSEWHILITNDDSNWNSYVQGLIATFDPSNWKEVELSDDSRGFEFHPPEYLMPPQEQVEINTQNLLILHRPIECRNRLDNISPIPDDQIADFLSIAKRLIDSNLSDTDLYSVSPPANAIAGTIAVLFHLHRQWLHENPEEETWCTNYISSILKNPPKWSEYDIPESVSNISWEHFLCEVLPILWAENPNNLEWRKLTVQLVRANHYTSTEILIRRSFEQRKSLGKYFWELFSLFIEWTKIRYNQRLQTSFRRKNRIQNSFENIFSELHWGGLVAKFMIGKPISKIPVQFTIKNESRPIWAHDIYHSRYLGKSDERFFYKVPQIDSLPLGS